MAVSAVIAAVVLIGAVGWAIRAGRSGDRDETVAATATSFEADTGSAAAPTLSTVITTGLAISITTSTGPSGPPPAEPPAQRCDGVETTAPSTALAGDVEVISMTLCVDGSIYVPGSGDWSSWNSHTVPTERLSELVAALSVPTIVAGPDTVCTLVGVLVPAIVVRYADGAAGLIAVPSDGCHPVESARSLLYEVIGSTTPTAERVKLTTGERELRSGCIGAKPVNPSPTTTSPRALPDATLSLCHYVTGADRNTVLRAAGPADDEVLGSLLATLAAAPPVGCPTPPMEGTEIGDFIAVNPAPAVAPPAERPVLPDGGSVLFIETGRCHIVVDDGWTTLGWADPALVAELVAATS